MNIFKRIWNTGLLRKIAIDNGMDYDKTSVTSLLFKDSFKIKNIKHNNIVEDIKSKMVMIFNEATEEDYSYIKKDFYYQI